MINQHSFVFKVKYDKVVKNKKWRYIKGIQSQELHNGFVGEDYIGIQILVKGNNDLVMNYEGIELTIDTYIGDQSDLENIWKEVINTDQAGQENKKILDLFCHNIANQINTSTLSYTELKDIFDKEYPFQALPTVDLENSRLIEVYVFTGRKNMQAITSVSSQCAGNAPYVGVHKSDYYRTSCVTSASGQAISCSNGGISNYQYSYPCTNTRKKIFLLEVRNIASSTKTYTFSIAAWSLCANESSQGLPSAVREKCL